MVLYASVPFTLIQIRTAAAAAIGYLLPSALSFDKKKGPSPTTYMDSIER